MNPQPDIQSLIDDINSILSLGRGNRLPWSRSMPTDATKQRRVLERVRDYLLHQQITARSEVTPEISIDSRLQQLISQQVRQELQAQATLHSSDSTNLGGMGLDALESWGQHDADSLALRRPNGSFSDIQQQEIMSSFSALMHELQESLHQQMQQAFTQINSQITQIRSSSPALDLSENLVPRSGLSAQPDPQADLPGMLSAKERWEKMQLLQQQSDQLLLAIDSNQRIIFETLQRHLQTYQQSLSHKLSGMYQLGMQTEVVFTGLVQQLVQQMETELEARQKAFAELGTSQAPQLVAMPELLANQGAQTGMRGDAIAPDSLTTNIFAPASPPALSFSQSSESSLQGANQDLTNDGADLNWDILGAIPSEANAEADIDALINLNLGLNSGDGNPTPPEDIDGIIASLNTPLEPFAADKDTIPDGGEELYTSLFSLDLEDNDLESALFGEEVSESDSAIISSPEDVSWEVALFDTDAPESTAIVPSSEEEEEPEIIQQLTDLIDPASRPELPSPIAPESALLSDTAESGSPDLSWGVDTELADDLYIPAAPEESLLLTSSPNPATNIALGQDIWLQLDQDLADFEAGITPTPATVSSESELELREVEDLLPPVEIYPLVSDRPISDELLAEDWQATTSLQEENEENIVVETREVTGIANISTETRESIEVDNILDESVKVVGFTGVVAGFIGITEAIDIPDISNESRESVEVADISDESRKVADILDISSESRESVEVADISDESREVADIPDISNELRESGEVADIPDISNELRESGEVANIPDESREVVDVANIPNISDESREVADILDISNESIESGEVADILDISNETRESLEAADILGISDESREVADTLDIPDISNETRESLAVVNISDEPTEVVGVAKSTEVVDISDEPTEVAEVPESREVGEPVSPEALIPEGIAANIPPEQIFINSESFIPSNNFASLDLDDEELASLEGIAIEDAPQSESALIAQLLIDEALDQELEIVNSLDLNPEARLNPTDHELLESFSVESFDRAELDDHDHQDLIDGLFAEELGISPSLRLSLSPQRLLRAEDDTLTEIPHDENEPEQSGQEQSNDANLDELDSSSSSSKSEIRFLDNGELLVETEANIETNYPLNLDESELMEMVWNQILGRDSLESEYADNMADQYLENGGQYSSIAEDQDNGEYSSQEVLDLEIQDALNEGFSEWENSPNYLENNLGNNHETELSMPASGSPAIASTAVPAIATTVAQAISNPGSNSPKPVNSEDYQIPQGSPIPITEINSATWYLGIDFGTTSLGAVLLNQTTGELYPLYWQPGEESSLVMTNSTIEPSRSSSLPTGVYGNPQAPEAVMYPVGLGVPEALAPEQMLCQNFKPYLDLGIPYWTESGWQPILRLAQNQPLVSMHWLQKATQALFSGLNSQAAVTQKLRATGIAPEILVNILDSIAGVILNCPTKSGDAYRWNLREAALAAGLVPQPEQVVFVEEAIAPFLASLQIRHTDASYPTHFPWRGYTLVINSGATATEFALVNANQSQNLTHGDFGLWSFPYAGNAFDQDIICQLLLSPATKIMQNIYETDKLLLANDLELPIAGELETTNRQRLHFWLQSSAWGQTLLIAAQNLKLHLQTKTEHRLVLGSDQWLIQQDQYESMVVIPFLQQLNQQLNNFLSMTGVAEHSIFQVVCAGGTATSVLLTEWLKIKLPQAVAIEKIGLPVGTMVAAGLASLPLYPQICGQAQQYSDYFLLMELLRILPLDTSATAEDVEAPNYHLEEINQMLEHRGINTRACGDRILDILRGELPGGLIPQLNQNIWLATASQQHPDYLALKSAKLFTQDGQNYYQPNLEQCRRFYKYMTAMLDKTQQKLEEPLIFDLG